MTEAEIRAALARPRRAAPDPRDAPGRPPAIGAPREAIALAAHRDDAADLLDRPLVEAAVLVGIVLGAAPGVLLTRRTAHLRAHAGQVAFPCGRIDPGDADAEATALREAQEEVGLDPACVELAGRMEGYVTGTGFRITPVIGLLGEAPVLHPNADEVAAIFRLPLSVLMDPKAPERRRSEHRGRMREFWVWPHPEHYVWGATAAILVHLAALLRGPAADAA